MLKVGCLSDTHGFLDSSIQKYIKDRDLLIHAGDIGSIEVLNTLQSWKPTLAVWGNIDHLSIQMATQEYLIKDLNGLLTLIVHIAGKPPRYNARVSKLIRTHRPNLLICGHSHILKVAPDPENQLLYINPGACGHHGFHLMRTLIRFDIQEGKIKNPDVVELGKRGSLKH